MSIKANPSDITLRVDPNSHLATLVFGKLEMDYPDGIPAWFEDCSFTFSYVENQPSRALSVPMRPGFAAYLEVLDMAKGIFLIGFRRQ